MLIFVNNISILIFDALNTVDIRPEKYDNEFDLNESIVEFEQLKGTLLIKNANFKSILGFINLAQNNEIEDLKSINFRVENEYLIKYKIITKLYFIKAAGGVVKNKSGNILMIKRLGLWDLPKGKAEKRELSKETAKREVEEECGVEVSVQSKICTTWHTYVQKGSMVIKQTKWYYMNLVSDKNMSPQTEEGIEDLRWMNEEQVQKALKKSYRSIAYVMQKYEK